MLTNYLRIHSKSLLYDYLEASRASKAILHKNRAQHIYNKLLLSWNEEIDGEFNREESKKRVKSKPGTHS